MNTFSLEQLKAICSLEAEVIRLTNGIKEIIKLSNAGKTLPHVDSHIASFCKKLINTEPPLPNTVLSAEEIVEENFKGLADFIEDADTLDWYKRLIVTCMEEYNGASDNKASSPVASHAASSGNSIEEAWFWWKETLNYSEAKAIAEKYRMKPPMTDEKVLFMFNSEQARSSVGSSIQHRFKTLMYGGIFVDTTLLHAGIYQTIKPILYNHNKTLESIIHDAKYVAKRGLVNDFDIEQYIYNISQCKLESVIVMLNSTPNPEPSCFL